LNVAGSSNISGDLNVTGWTTSATSREYSFNIVQSNDGDGRWDILEFSYDTANWGNAILEIEITKTAYDTPEKTIFLIKRGYGGSLDYEVLYGGGIVGYWHSETVVSGNIKKATFAINRPNYYSYNVKINASTAYTPVTTITSSGQIKIVNAWNSSQLASTNTGNTLFAQSGGNVGIAMTDPSVKLDVTGDIEYTGTITDVSDQRLKENIVGINNSISKIQGINGVYFNMIGSDKRELGVIAQNVQQVLPEAVSIVDPEKGYLGVDYTSLVPILIEAIKEQQKQIQALRQDIEQLERNL